VSEKAAVSNRNLSVLAQEVRLQLILVAADKRFFFTRTFAFCMSLSLKLLYGSP
jgi:hypothetical protein